MKKLLLPALIILLLAAFKSDSPALKTISGIVKDKDSGSPLRGVAISTSSGKVKTSTGKDGRYSINIGDGEKTLTFSYIGYTSVTIPVRASSDINVSMAENKTKLEEVVVVGYGTVHKSDRVGSLSKADPGAAMSESRVMLKGSVAGVSVHKGERSATASSKPAEAPRAESLKLKEGRPGKQKPQSNLLTAGEWNDLSNWDFWKDLMNNQDWSAKQSHWEFYTANRLGVTIKNKSQQPLVNYTVTALRNGVPLWKAQSNFEGRAELWPSLYDK